VSPRRRRRRGQLIESRALASELGALLERLDIDAVLTDRTGIALAATRQAERGEGRPRRVVELRLAGQALYVAVAQEPADGGAPGATLTNRQREVSELLRDGLRNREIAQRLGISVHTVRRHVESVLSRLEVPTRTSAAVLLNGVEDA
jgi:DNA-binding NarL/FixJ family response regulator